VESPGTDAEWSLSAGPWRATVSPLGASLRRLWLERPGEAPRDVLWGYMGEAKKGGQGDVLMPWPGRIRDGRYGFQGRELTLPANDKQGPNAIHGFLRSRVWTGDHDASTARFRTRIRANDHVGYPFELDVVVGYELLPGGLACAFVAHNPGTTPAPFGAGFHPYVLASGAAVDGVKLRCTAAHVVETEGLLPTGRILEVPAGLDFRVPRRVGGTQLNHCFTGLGREADGFARVRVDDVEVWMDKGFPYVVLYTGDALGPDARRALAVEPMTCATDAFNHPKWGLRVLGPGEAMTATWGVALQSMVERSQGSR
jgi:aldose 1-epimerase